MNFFKFLLYSSFIIILYLRLKSGPYIYQSSKKHNINIKNHKFDVEYLKIKKGDTLIFNNKDQIRHTVKTNNNFIENSPLLFQNDRWEIILNTESKIVEFKSSLYENMNKVKVEIEDIYKDTTAKNIFRNNLLNLKKKGMEISDTYLKKLK